MMRILLIIALIVWFENKAAAQRLDTLYFNLYTDSLKKGTFNYINVEGRYDNGRYLPLTAETVKLSASYGEFQGNSLFIDTACKEEKVTVKAVSLINSNLYDEIVIYIKKVESEERLPTAEEVLKGKRRRR